MPDNEILSRARSGDENAFAELYRHNLRAATRYAQCLVSNEQDVEDLVAESFTLVIDQLRSGRGPETSFRAYLFTTMRHRVFADTRREVSVSDPALLDSLVEPVDVELAVDGELILAGFNTLPSIDKQILLMLDVQELRPAEVGSRLGLRPSAVSMRAARARDALAEAYLVAHTQPGKSHDCERVRNEYGRYVRGRLPAVCSRKVKAHLEGCSRCRATVGELADVNRALRGLPLFAGVASGKHGIGWLFAGSHGGPSAVAAKVAVAAAGLGVATTAGFVIAASVAGPHHPAQAPTLQPVLASAIHSERPAAPPLLRTSSPAPVQPRAAAASGSTPVVSRPTAVPATPSASVLVTVPAIKVTPAVTVPAAQLPTLTTPPVTVTVTMTGSSPPAISPTATPPAPPSAAPTPSSTTTPPRVYCGPFGLICVTR